MKPLTITLLFLATSLGSTFHFKAERISTISFHSLFCLVSRDGLGICRTDWFKVLERLAIVLAMRMLSDLFRLSPGVPQRMSLTGACLTNESPGGTCGEEVCFLDFLPDYMFTKC